MNIKEEYKKLLEKIKTNRKDAGLGYRNEDIAEELGYNRSYFSTLLGDKGVITENHLKTLKLHFGGMLENVTRETRLSAEGLNITLGDYIDEIKQQKQFLQELLSQKVTGVEDVLVAIKDLLSSGTSGQVSPASLQKEKASAAPVAKIGLGKQGKSSAKKGEKQKGSVQD